MGLDRASKLTLLKSETLRGRYASVEDGRVCSHAIASVVPMGRKRAAMTGTVQPIAGLIAYHDAVREQLRALATIDEEIHCRDAEALVDAERLADAVGLVLGREGQFHALDETESVFPRVRSALGPRDRDVLAAIDHLDVLHSRQSPAWAELRNLLWQIVVPDAVVSIQRFRTARLTLEREFLPHLDLEERVVFPAATRVLSRSTLTVIAHEMAARRAHSLPLEAPVAP